MLMLARVLSSICAVVTAGAGVLLMDCEWSFLAVDSMGVCTTVESFGLTRSAYVGIGLAVFALLALISVWVSGGEPKAKKGKIDREESLLRNIERISGPVGTLDPVELDDYESAAVDLDTRAIEVVGARPEPVGASIFDRLEALELVLSGGNAAPTHEETEQWMRLLREANDLHNGGELATEDFKTINTRLLDLVIEPAAVV
jgi:hypothetical protein